MTVLGLCPFGSCVDFSPTHCLGNDGETLRGDYTDIFDCVAGGAAFVDADLSDSRLQLGQDSVFVTNSTIDRTTFEFGSGVMIVESSGVSPVFLTDPIHLTGVRLRGADFSGRASELVVRDSGCFECDFEGLTSRFFEASYGSLEGSVFDSSRLENAVFDSVNLARVSFRGAELSDSSFASVDFSQTDVTDAVFHLVDFLGSTGLVHAEGFETATFEGVTCYDGSPSATGSLCEF